MRFYFKCPRCSNNKSFVKVDENHAPLGCAFLLFAGVLPFLLLACHARARVQCTKCGYIFRQPSLPQCGVSKFSVWMLLLIFLFVGLLIFLCCLGDAEYLLPEFSLISKIEELISSESRLVAYFIVALIGAILFSCVMTLVVNNWKHRKEMEQAFYLKPFRSVAEAEKKQEESQSDDPLL